MESTANNAVTTEGFTDPYGSLWCVVGDEDDYIALDYYIDHFSKRVLLHAVLNCESSAFIQNFKTPHWYPYNEAIEAARELEGEAVSWCVENGVPMDREGWNTDPEAFYEAVSQSVLRALGGK